MLKAGDKFPGMTLEGTLRGEKKSYNTGENTGKSKVFIFFPFAFTPV